MNTLFDIERAKQFVRQKQETERATNKRRLQQARTDFDTIVAELIKKYHPARIWQWGSLMDGQHFDALSDIDIAIEDETIDIGKIYDELQELTSFKLHLCQWSMCNEFYKYRIKNNGRLVYERQDK